MEKSTLLKILIINLLILFLLGFSFRTLYGLATELNNEISFRNYIKEYQINPYIDIQNIKKEQLNFPNHIQVLLVLALILILEQTLTIISIYRQSIKNKQNNKLIKP